MVRVRTLASLALISIMAAGCYSHTSVGMNYYYPPGSSDSAAQYHLSIGVEGAPRHAYTDRTEKTVYVTIKSIDRVLLSREYRLVAASLESGVRWEKRDDLEIVFFDFPQGISIYDLNTVQPPAKQIFTVRFTYDGNSGQFTEFPVPAEVVSRARTGKKT